MKFDPKKKGGLTLMEKPKRSMMNLTKFINGQLTAERRSNVPKLHVEDLSKAPISGFAHLRFGEQKIL